MWVALALVGIITLLIYYLTRPPKDFWGKYGVRQVHDANFKDKIEIILGRKTIMDIDENTYKLLESTNEKFCGLVELQGNTVLIKDLDLAKKVLIKDFEFFMDRRLAISSDAQPIFRKFLLNLQGEEWKSVRCSLTPAFSTAKIRRMMEHFNKISNEWVDHLKAEVAKSSDNSVVIKVSEEVRHFTVDIIASTAFGMEAKAISNPDSVFADMCERLSSMGFVQVVKFLLAIFLPKVTMFIGLKVVDDTAMNFFENILLQGLRARMSGTIKQNDFIQLVADVRKGELKAQVGEELSAFEKDAKLADGDGETQRKDILKDDSTAIAQLLQLFFAGFSTSTNFISFALYALALNPDVQEKLREEIDSKLFQDGNDKELDYDKLNGLVYMDMFISEVLRTIPPAGRIERICVKDYHDQDTGLRVPKGAYLFVPLQALHRDPKYYEYPDKFYPEHFTAERKAERNSIAFMPFGSGPRNCIGMRFAMVFSKAGLASLVHQFIIEPTEKTPKTLEIKAVGLAVNPPNNLELKLRPRK